jgi:pimeloyl-ACP methyl ester carboxylesterase
MNVSKYGSADYRAADPRLRATFNRIVNENLKKFLRFICAETLILWGAADRDTPLWMAKKLNKKIRGSSLFVFPEGGHYSYIDYHGAFVEVCKQFFGVI